MSVVRVTEVQGQAASEFLHGGAIDVPRTGGAWEVYSFQVEGWALSRPAATIGTIEVVHKGRLLEQFPLDVVRPDVASAFPNVPDAENSGFKGWVNCLELPQEFEVLLRARLQSGRSFPIGSLRGVRKPVTSTQESSLSPVMINTIGRSGSTWLTWLLSCHPKIVAFEPFSHEPRLATYWMTVLQRLGHPRSYLAQFDPPDLAAPEWWLGEPSVNRGILRKREVATWLGDARIASLAGACMAQIDDFYQSNAGATADSKFFVEKFSPWQVAPGLLRELYPEAKELILVRDFRDMFCSIRAFTAKRGHGGFGQKEDETEEEYITTTVRGFASALLELWRARADISHLVRYEDVVAKPRETLPSILAFLGLDSGEACVDQMIHAASEEPSGAGQHLTASNPAASIGRWRSDLAPELIGACESALGQQLEEFGYPRS